MTTNAQFFWFSVWLTCVIVVEWIARRRMRRIETSNAANMISNTERNVAAAAVVASNASVVAVMNENALLMTELLRVEKFNGRTVYRSKGGIA